MNKIIAASSVCIGTFVGSALANSLEKGFVIIFSQLVAIIAYQLLLTYVNKK